MHSFVDTTKISHDPPRGAEAGEIRSRTTTQNTNDSIFKQLSAIPNWLTTHLVDFFSRPVERALSHFLNFSSFWTAKKSAKLLFLFVFFQYMSWFQVFFPQSSFLPYPISQHCRQQCYVSNLLRFKNVKHAVATRSVIFKTIFDAMSLKVVVSKFDSYRQHP